MQNPYESPQTEQLPRKGKAWLLLYFFFMLLVLPVVIGGTEIVTGRIVSGFCWATILLCAEAVGMCAGAKLLEIDEVKK